MKANTLLLMWFLLTNLSSNMILRLEPNTASYHLIVKDAYTVSPWLNGPSFNYF